uniref:Endonuclease/exonuclease/phosphatase domain-containing protein n=1 Tax=Arion vulgaris TaxID=1028688 RepID=A0A0B7BPR8_9EUPU
MVESPINGSYHILSIKLRTVTGPVHLFSVYALTLHLKADIKDTFYEEIQSDIRRISQNEHIFLMRDFNARVGADHNSSPSCLGKHGTGKINENGQRLLEICNYNNLCITNTFFNTKPCHKVSWKHPRSHRWHQLDLVITRRNAINSVLSTRSYHSADCDTDHSLICGKVRLKIKTLHHSKRKGCHTLTPKIPPNQKWYNRSAIH